MKKKRCVLSWLLAVVLFAGLSLPIPVMAANLYFTAINAKRGGDGESSRPD